MSLLHFFEQGHFKAEINSEKTFDYRFCLSWRLSGNKEPIERGGYTKLLNF